MACRARSGRANEAITYYKDPHELVGSGDFVMANPPFNVDEVDAEKVKGDNVCLLGCQASTRRRRSQTQTILGFHTSTAI